MKNEEMVGKRKGGRWEVDGWMDEWTVKGMKAMEEGERCMDGCMFTEG